MVKCIIINGIPAVIEAVSAISELERPEDQDFSCTRCVDADSIANGVMLANAAW
jgi:hypothetical protein